MRRMGAIGGVAWLLTAGAAAAQEAPNLTGTWVPHGGAHILEGETLHRQSGTAPVEGAEGLARHTSPFVFRIENQDGRTFWGEFSSASITERLIGALSPDGERFVMADEDGWFSGTVVDVDTLDFCYVHVAPENRAVACGYLRRQD